MIDNINLGFIVRCIFHSPGLLRWFIISQKCVPVFSRYTFIDNFLYLSLLYSTLLYLPSNAYSIFWFIVCWCVLSIFDSKSSSMFYLVLLSDLCKDSGIWLINQKWPQNLLLIPNIFCYWSDFCHFHFFHTYPHQLEEVQLGA